MTYKCQVALCDTGGDSAESLTKEGGEGQGEGEAGLQGGEQAVGQGQKLHGVEGAIAGQVLELEAAGGAFAGGEGGTGGA